MNPTIDHPHPEAVKLPTRRQITLAEWQAEGERKFGPDQHNWAFVCPACNTPQTARDFYAAGFEPGKGEVNKYLGFSCIGRFTKAKGCDWTLGGLFQIHTLEVLVPLDSTPRRHFEFASNSSQAAA